MSIMPDKVVLGEGEFAYSVQDDWGLLPDGWRLGEVSAVGTDSRYHFYVFNRGEHPMVVFDREGNFLRSWGEDFFNRPHGLHVAPDDTIFCTDEGDDTVRQCSPTGKILLQLGVSGRRAPYCSGVPFHRCTHTALSPGGDIYVSDGYGNARIHKYAPDGRLLFSWGQPGTDPGEFSLPHNISCDEAGFVFVADRENHRVQVFDGDGRYETQWNNMHRPSALFLSRGKCPLCYIGELGPYLRSNRGMPNMGPRLSILTPEGKVLARLARTPAAGTAPGQFLSPHGIAVDSRGDIYVGEVSYTAWPSLFPDEPVPPSLRVLQKLIRRPPI
jgi:hypothetical protein